MSDAGLPGLGSPLPFKPNGNQIEHVLTQRPLHRILAFTRRTIDDVINDPIARNQVYGFYKLHRWIEREDEIGELERQWNALNS